MSRVQTSSSDADWQTEVSLKVGHVASSWGEPCSVVTSQVTDSDSSQLKYIFRWLNLTQVFYLNDFIWLVKSENDSDLALTHPRFD